MISGWLKTFMKSKLAIALILAPCVVLTCLSISDFSGESSESLDQPEKSRKYNSAPSLSNIERSPSSLDSISRTDERSNFSKLTTSNSINTESDYEQGYKSSVQEGFATSKAFQSKTIKGNVSSNYIASSPSLIVPVKTSSSESDYNGVYGITGKAFTDVENKEDVDGEDTLSVNYSYASTETSTPECNLSHEEGSYDDFFDLVISCNEDVLIFYCKSNSLLSCDPLSAGTTYLSSVRVGDDRGDISIFYYAQSVLTEVKTEVVGLTYSINASLTSRDFSPASFKEDMQSIINLPYSSVDSDLAISCSISNLENVIVSSPCVCTLGSCNVGITGASNYYGTASFDYFVSTSSETSNISTASLTIDDVASEFVSVWRTTGPGEAITLPLRESDGSGYNFVYNATVDWGDGSPVSSITTFDDVDRIHSYAVAGDYVVTITGIMETLYFNNSGDKDKIISVVSFGDLGWKSLEGSFYGCSNLVSFAGGKTTSATSMFLTFAMTGLTSLDVTSFNTSNVTSMYGAFAANGNLSSLDVSSLDTSNVIDMTVMFVSSGYEKLDLSNFDTSNVTSMSQIFANIPSLEELNVMGWDISNASGAVAVFSGTDPEKVYCDQGGSPGTGTFYGEPCDSLFSPTSFEITPAPLDMDTETFIVLSYIDPQSDKASACSISNPSNITITTPCSCSLGVCSVGVTGLSGYKGLASFDYYVTANSDISNTSIANLYIQSGTPFISTWRTTGAGESITLPLVDGYSYNASIDWGDGSPEEHISSFDDEHISHVYSVAGDYTVTIKGVMEAWDFESYSGGSCKIIAVNELGDLSWKNLSGAFSGCSDLISFSGGSTSLVTNMSLMFSSTGVSHLDLSGFNTLSLTSVEKMFQNTPGLATLNVMGWDVSNITTSSLIFDNSNPDVFCDQGGAPGHGSFFGRPCYSEFSPVTNSFSPASFDVDTQSLITLPYSDYQSDQATSCSVSNLVRVTITTPCNCSAGVCTVGVTGVGGFYGTASFDYTVTTNSDISNSSTVNLNIDIAPVTKDIVPESFKEDVQSLVTLPYVDLDQASSCSISNLINLTISKPCTCSAGVCKVGIIGTPEYFGSASFDFTVTANSKISNVSTASLTIEDVRSEFISIWRTTSANESITLPLREDDDDGYTFVYNATVDWGDGSPLEQITSYNDSNRTHTYAVAGDHTVTITGTMEAWYTTYSAAHRNKLIEVTHFGDLGWKDLEKAFYRNENLVSFAGGKTKNVTNMRGLFSYSSGLVDVDLTSFDTSNVTDMGQLFTSSVSITSLDLSSFDTSNVTAMDSMFYNLPLITTLNLSNFDTSNVIFMNQMFNRLSGLETIDVSNFDTSNVTTFFMIFAEMTNLEILDLSSFNTSSVSQMREMFKENPNLVSVNLNGWDTSAVVYSRNIFRNTDALVYCDQGGEPGTGTFFGEACALDIAPVSVDLNPPNMTQDTETMIELVYSDNESHEASSCTLSNLINLSQTTNCRCVNGVCSVGVTGRLGYFGSASFDYVVKANSSTSNTSTATITIDSN